MISENHNRGLLILCIGSAGLCGTVYLVIAPNLWPTTSMSIIMGQALIFAVLILCIGAIGVSLPDVISHYLEHIQHWRKLSAIPSEPVHHTSQETLQQTPRHKYGAECQSYWLSALSYAQEVGGVSFSRMKDFFAGDHATWRDCFALPMVRAGYINPVQSRVETVCADDWTVDKIKWALESGRSKLTPLPYAPPSPFDKYKTDTTVDNSEETTVFASTTRK